MTLVDILPTKIINFSMNAEIYYTEIVHTYTYIPIQILGPSPNGRNVPFGLVLMFSSENLFGLNLSGSGKYCGS